MSNDDPKMHLGPDHDLCPSHVDVDGKPFAFCTNHLGHTGPCSYFLSSERADTAIAQLKKEVAALEKLNEAVTSDHIRAVELAYVARGCKSECEADFRDALERIRADVAEASPHEVAALIDSVLLRHPPHGAENPAQTGERSAKVEGTRKGDRWPTVTVFAEAMRAKLEQHRAEKGGREGWWDDDPMGLANRVAEELRELRGALILMSPDPRRVLEEAADVANMAMMVADAAGALEVPAVEAEAEAELPLPTGPRPDSRRLAWLMSGMPKVGRTSVDVHVFDELRAELQAVTRERDGFKQLVPAHAKAMTEAALTIATLTRECETKAEGEPPNLGLFAEFYYLVEWKTGESRSWCRRPGDHKTLEEARTEARKLVRGIGNGAVVQIRHTTTRAVCIVSHYEPTSAVCIVSPRG